MNKRTIIYIVVFSSLLGFVFNHFNPKGIRIDRTAVERTWTDSPLLPDDSLVEHKDTTAIEGITSDSTSKNKSASNNTKDGGKDSVKKEVSQNQIKDFEKPLAISLENAYKLYKQGVTFVDARNREDYLRNHIPNSINIPFYQFEEYKGELIKIDKTKPFVIYCNGKDCDMSDMLADVLFEMNYKKIYLFVGGWEEWEIARYPSSIPYEE